MPTNIYSGTSGLVVPINQSAYPPEYAGTSRLTYYASLFNSIEINSIFYKLPRAATISNWAQSVPATFRFTFKLSKAITHCKDLIYDVRDIDPFIQAIAPALDNKICILVQFPRGLKIENINRLEELLSTLRKAIGTNDLAVELRHPSWYNSDVYAILDAHGATLAVHDMEPNPPLDVTKVPVKYIRFHGPGGRYRGSYTDEFLLPYAQLIRKWAAEGQTVYYYFNNTMGDAFKNLQTLNRMVGV